MTKSDFGSINDLKNVGEAIKRWLVDSRSASVFELAVNDASYLTDDAVGNVYDLAYLMEPKLKRNDVAFSDSVRSKALSLDQESKITGALVDAADAFFSLGVIVGAYLAEPTGRVSDRLIDGWIKTRLANPRYEHLKTKADAPRAAPQKRSRSRNRRRRAS